MNDTIYILALKSKVKNRVYSPVIARVLFVWSRQSGKDDGN